MKYIDTDIVIEGNPELERRVAARLADAVNATRRFSDTLKRMLEGMSEEDLLRLFEDDQT